MRDDQDGIKKAQVIDRTGEQTGRDRAEDKSGGVSDPARWGTTIGQPDRYQARRTPNWMTRGATTAWMLLAFDAFWRLRIA